MAGAPNPLSVAFSILKARRVRSPNPTGSGAVDHSAFAPILRMLDSDGVAILVAERTRITAYRESLEVVDPDTLTHDGALAYWLNLYNAGALRLAAEALENGEDTVLRVARGFDRPWALVGAERLSLNAIEHGKIRRFGDPRIHAALVCGSVSCPTLRAEPFTGDGLEAELESQMRSFLESGGARADREAHQLHLSRIFLWYGADLVRPERMPTLLPARKRAVATAVSRWLSERDARWVREEWPKVRFAPYSWELACSIA